MVVRQSSTANLICIALKSNMFIRIGCEHGMDDILNKVHKRFPSTVNLYITVILGKWAGDRYIKGDLYIQVSSKLYWKLMNSNRPRSICFAAQGGNYTKSRPGGRWVELWRQPRVSLIRFFLVTFRYFVSEMVLTCAVSIYIICKYGNGEIFTQSEEENGSRHL